MSCTQLALSAGISRSTVTHLERNEARPTLWVLLKIAGVLNMDLSECLKNAKATEHDT